jgi:cytochrome c
MKYYRFNQIAMAVLGALLLFFGARTIINIAYEEPESEKPGYEVSGTEEKPGGGEVKPGGGAELATLLASADPKRGADIAKKCMVCHNFDKDGPNMIGPNLYGVLGGKIASHEGYEYSDALKSKEGDWTYENVNHMIENPNAFAPGTKMALFPGLPDAKQRADVLAFLRTKNDNAPPLPEATAEEKPGEVKPGEEKPGEAKRAEAGGDDAAFLALIAKADPKQGETDAALCKVCHSFQKGGPAIVGPDLYGVVGRKIASVEGFNYTPALKAHEGDWTFPKLDAWLKNPQAFASGTAMAFPGVPDDKKRAAIIAFLRVNSESPVPLPEAGAAKPEEKAIEKPAAPEEAAPAASEAPPAAETPAPAEETPAAEPEAPAAPEEAAPTEEAPAPGEEAPPGAETPAPAEETPAAEPEAPAAPEEAAPAEETPAPAEEAAPAEEPIAPAEESAEPSTGEPPFANQPQPVYPEGEPEDSDTTGALAPAPAEDYLANQPQPVYPDGPPEGAE